MATWDDLFGGGVLVTTVLSGRQSISSGSSGILFTLTPSTSEHRVTLVSLGMFADLVNELNISVEINEVAIITGTIRNNPNTDGYFAISPYHSGTSGSGSTGFNNSIGVFNSITAGPGATIRVRKTSGTTDNVINYSHSESLLK